MAKTSSLRWLAIRLVVASGLGFPVALHGCGADAPEEPGASEPSSSPSAREAESAGPPVAVPPPRVLGLEGLDARASRRVAEGCDPGVQALESQGFVGSRALAILSWDGASQRAADLRIPVYVVDVADGGIGARFLQFPMREEYLHIWLGSGHIRAVPASDVFRLDPCSASLVPWPYPAEAD